MATMAMSRPVRLHQPAPGIASSGISSLDGAIGFNVDDMTDQAVPAQSPAPPLVVPNKHIPVCPPGPPVASTTPSPSPPPPGREIDRSQQSLLFPPDAYPCATNGQLSLYRIDPADVAAAVDFAARQPMPDPSCVFPWLHGMHPNNHIQQAFFSQRRRYIPKTPSCLRGVTLVKADGQLSTARLKGAIAPGEILASNGAAEFVDPDPREGFSVRNFQIQAAKTATTSDIIVYGDNEAVVEALAWKIAAAQQRWYAAHVNATGSGADADALPVYNTFACVTAFDAFESMCPHLVTVDAAGRLTGNVFSFAFQERHEMYTMTRASEIAHNVWLGPTPEPDSDDERRFDVLIECCDMGHLNPQALRDLAAMEFLPGQRMYVDFPSSGTILPPTWSQAEADGILDTCKWIHHLAHGTRPPPSPPPTEFEISDDGIDGIDGIDGLDEEYAVAAARNADTFMSDAAATTTTPATPEPRKILIHCADGYTESTMLALAYFSFSTGLPIPEAWLRLHTAKRRNFFAYPTDVALLGAIGMRLLCESPARSADKNIGAVTALVQDPPKWFLALDGSLPSRILDYMYLGNLNHANNPRLLRALGITQILSVGEMAMWQDDDLRDWGEDNVCIVQGVQDNGIDPLMDEFDRCLKFIGTATLVHCRVGVSRSATICIAEVMRSRQLSLPRAYCFVRARRLNVIIQPHLRFAYELLKWEEMLRQKQEEHQEHQQQQQQQQHQQRRRRPPSPPGSESETADDECPMPGRHGGVKRELEWGDIAREVALMNQPYVR